MKARQRIVIAVITNTERADHDVLLQDGVVAERRGLEVVHTAGLNDRLMADVQVLALVLEVVLLGGENGLLDLHLMQSSRNYLVSNLAVLHTAVVLGDVLQLRDEHVLHQAAAGDTRTGELLLLRRRLYGEHQTHTGRHVHLLERGVLDAVEEFCDELALKVGLLLHKHTNATL